MVVTPLISSPTPHSLLPTPYFQVRSIELHSHLKANCTTKIIELDNSLGTTTLVAPLSPATP